MKEIEEGWKPIEGYEGIYEVSNLGNVRSEDREVWNGKGTYVKKGRLLKQSKTTTGYWKIELSKNGSRKSFKVHRLVALAFIPEEPGKTIINHIDGNPLNNEVGNLEWCNQSENMKHAYKNQLKPNNFHLYRDRITKEYTSGKLNIRQLARKYNCSNQTITKYFKEEGIRIKSSAEAKDKYKIDRLALVADFDKGMRNVDIAKKHNTNRHLIGVYKHKYKKGELL